MEGIRFLKGSLSLQVHLDREAARDAAAPDLEPGDSSVVSLERHALWPEGQGLGEEHSFAGAAKEFEKVGRAVISVVLPTFNRAVFLVEAIESVLSQTHQDHELIVVNNGRTGETEQALHRFRDRLRYVVHPERGAARARNRGLNEAKGDWIAFLDDDDRWLPYKLELQMACLNRYPHLGFLFSDFMAFDESGVVATSYIRRYFSSLDRNHVSFEKVFKEHVPLSEFANSEHSWGDGRFYQGMIFPTLLLGNFVLTSTTLAKKSLLVQLGGFCEAFEVVEDADLFLRMSLEGSAGYIDVPTAQYRLGENRLTGTDLRRLSVWQNNLQSVRSLMKNRPHLMKEYPGPIRKRLAQLHRKIAYRHFLNGDASDARDHWRESLMNDRFQWPSYIGWMGTWIPPFLIAWLRNVRRWSLHRGVEL